MNELNGKNKYKLQWIILIWRKLNYSNFNYCDQPHHNQTKCSDICLNGILIMIIISIMSVIPTFIAKNRSNF